MSLTEQIEALKIASAEQTLASQKLAQEVSSTIKEIKDEASKVADEINKLLQDPLLITIYLSNDGDDSNTGAFNSPLKTFAEIFRRAPKGGTCFIKVTGNYTLSEITWLSDLNIVIDLQNETTIFEQGLKDGISASLRVGSRSDIYVLNGKIRTDFNLSSNKDSAFFSRQDGSKACLRLFRTDVELGDNYLFSAGQTANGLHEFAFGHGELSLREGRTRPTIFVQFVNSCAVLTLSTITNSTGLPMRDLISGVFRDSSGNPTNILTNAQDLWSNA